MPGKTHVLLAATATTAALLAGACGGRGAETAVGSAANRARVRAVGVKSAELPSASPSARPTPTAPPAIDPGTLPQTDALPSDQDARFKARVEALWQAIVQDKPELAQPFFFPLSAYKQVKAIWDPAADYQNRLIAWYALDIHAAHDHLGTESGTARLVSMDVPESNAEWIEPGVEYNKGSYYRVYGTRLNYQVNDGHAASIGVFSLISWRGEWYVVHLGPSTRSEMEGIVYDPSS